MNLLTISDLSDDDVNAIFDKATRGCRQPLSTITGIHMFFESSTRTKISFEIAGARLSHTVVTFQASTSSMNKGESLTDTVKTLTDMGADYFVVRDRDHFTLERVAAATDAVVINAGSGTDHHPTQALIDVYTAQRHFGSLEGKRVLFLGDVGSSRVYQSTGLLFQRFGATTTTHPGEIGNADIIVCLRPQRERNTYWAEFPRLSASDEPSLKPSCVIMHPGPVTYEEIDKSIASGPRSLIDEQVRNGVAVRTALLSYLLERKQ